VLFVWCDLCHASDENVPSLDFIGKRQDIRKTVKLDEKIEKTWQIQLQNYGFKYLNDLAVELFNYVVCGRVDGNNLTNRVEGLKEKIRQSKLEGSFHSSWNNYFNSCSKDEEFVVSSMYHSFMSSCEFVSINNLNNLILFFRELGHDDKITTMIKDYCSHLKRDLTKLDKELRFQQADLDKELATELELLQCQSRGWIELEDIARQIVSSIELSSEDKRIIVQATKENYYDLFMSLEHDELNSIVSTLLDIGDNHYKVQGGKVSPVEEALREIAGQSKINEIRVRRFGIKLRPIND
tara:strand:- start:287 stop:1174 length:888 start_codon:yes stop_codon:yes gene_type:complete